MEETGLTNQGHSRSIPFCTKLKLRLSSRLTHRVVMVGLLLGLFAVCLYALVPEALLAQELACPHLVDFGVVKPGVERKIVRVQNWSFSSVNILNVVTNCGCTVAKITTPRRLLFRETADIEITLDSTRVVGPVEKRIAIETDNTRRPVQVIDVRAVVDSSLIPSLVPPAIDFGTFGKWQLPSRRMLLVDNGPGVLHLNNDVISSTGIAIIPDGVDGGYPAFRVSILDELLPGPFLKRIPVKTSQGEDFLELRGIKNDWAFFEVSPLVFWKQASARLIPKVARLCHDPSLAVPRMTVSCDLGEIMNVESEPVAPDILEVRFHLSPDTNSRSFVRGTVTVSFPDAGLTSSIVVPAVLAVKRNN